MTKPTTTDAGPVTGTPRPASVPAALRSRRPGWRDPRILVGMAIVAACVLLGAKVMGSAADTVEVAVLTRDLPAGAAVAATDLERHRVHFDTAADAARYFVDGALPEDGSVLGQPAGAGELLARSAVSTAAGARLVEVPLSLAPEDLPATVARGVVVDVWVTPRTPTSENGVTRARLVLDDVLVLAVPRSQDSLAPTTERQVIVGVDRDQQAELALALGRMADGRVVLTRQPAGAGQ